MNIENAILIHGTFGSPDENWMGWLKKELERKGVEVIAPQFPAGEEQNLKNWLRVFENYKHVMGPKTIMVGHNIGPAFIFRVLERSNVRILSSFLVAPFSRTLRVPKHDEANSTFLEKEFDWDKIRKNCASFHVYGSDNDPYVKFSQEDFVAKRLDATMRVIEGAGHMDSEAGYREFKELLGDISFLLKGD